MTLNAWKVVLTLVVVAPGLALAQSDAGVDEMPYSEAELSGQGPETKGEDVVDLSHRLAALEEQYLETQSTVFSLSKIKLSGYVQGRYQYAQNSVSGAVKDGFTVRRGRLKATYTGTWSQFVVQIDATPKGVVLKDAEAHFRPPVGDPNERTLDVVFGQTKWPFGYEGPQSSSEREMPERSRVVRAFLPGERDRGIKVVGTWRFVRAAVGVFDGNGIDNKAFAGVDNDTEKDVVGRLGVDFTWIAAGVSGWVGKTYKPSDFSLNPAFKGRFYDRNRLGFDLQIYLNPLPFGGTAFKAEWIAGRTFTRDNLEVIGAPAIGWYMLLVQSIGDDHQIAARFDYFDPLAGTLNMADNKDPAKPALNNAVATLGLLYSYYFDEALKASIIYEIPMTQTVTGAVDPADNVFTLQLQAKF